MDKKNTMDFGGKKSGEKQTLYNEDDDDDDEMKWSHSLFMFLTY